MWSLPSRSLATAVSLIAVLFLVQSAATTPVAAHDCMSPAATPAVSPAIHTPSGVNLVVNGDFKSGMLCWMQFATPDENYIVATVTDKVMNFYRVPPPDGERSNQAVLFQRTSVALGALAPIHVTFDLGNSSNVRKRISVLIHEADFSDLRACTFWLAPHSPLRSYRMRTHTSRAWANTTISFYASSPGSVGGFYEVDNVWMTHEPRGDVDRTLCDDSDAPPPSDAPDGPNLLDNGDFSAGLGPWATFHGLTHQVFNGTFEFVWEPTPGPDGPAPVVLQSTGTSLAAGEILTARLALGNSSSVRKRVSLLVHETDFSDLGVCTFWLEPGAPLQTYTMRMFTTEPWSNAVVSVYAATRGSERWIRMDNAVLQRTPGAEIGGKECYEPTAAVPAASQPRINRSARLAAGAPGFAARMGAARARTADGPMQTAGGPGTIVLQPASLRYLVPPSDVALDVQVSEDGETWLTLHTVDPSEDWQVVTLDASGVGGAVMFIRVVR